MPLLTSSGRLQRLSKLPQDGPNSRLQCLQSLQNQCKKLENSESYILVQTSIQFAVNFHIPYEKLTLSNLLPIVYAQ